jgi:hypothetical protein
MGGGQEADSPIALISEMEAAVWHLLIRQENSDIAFPPISAKNAEMDGAP